MAEAKSSTASLALEEHSNASDLALEDSAATSSCPAGRNHARNSRQKDNLRAKCTRAVARADSLEESLKLVLEENSALRKEKVQAEEFIVSLKRDMTHSQECIASLRRDNDSLRAALAVRGSIAAPEPAGGTAALSATVQDLDQCIQSMDS